MTGLKESTGLKPSFPFVSLGLFGLAMGILEAVVAIYLRQLYYPEGFGFPLTPLSSEALFTESVREMATIIMLGTVAFVSGKSRVQRLSSFFYIFPLWDIAYYIGLKLFLDWPPSLLTWDLLFLVPVMWVGPVLAPVICSCTMVIFAIGLSVLERRGYHVTIMPAEAGTCLAGASLILLAFTWDTLKMIAEAGLLSQLWRVATDRLFQDLLSQYRPTDFLWAPFLLGEALALLSFFMMAKRTMGRSARA
jgi:hypothetical protein